MQNPLLMAAPQPMRPARQMPQQLAHPAQPAPAPQAGPMGPSPFAMPVEKPNLLTSALNGFQMGFDPKAYDARMQQEQGDAATKQKQTLALMQQQRQLPPEQRAMWWQQNAPQISQIVGKDVSQAPVDPSQFSDQALDQHIAMLSAQMGQGPAQVDPVNFQGVSLGNGGYGVLNPRTGQVEIVREPTPAEPANKPPNWQTEVIGDQVIAYNPQNPSEQKVLGPAPAKGSNGIQLQFGEGGVLSGLSVGGTGPKGQEPAIIRGPGDKPVVSPGKQQLEANKDWKSLQDFNAQNGLVLEEIGRALAAVKPSSTGIMAATADIPIFGASTDAGRLKNLVNTIKANVGFDKLQSMRENSPTGGALGQVAIQEIQFLQSVFGSLETAQREEDVRYNLQRLAKFLEGRSERLKAAFAQDYPDLAQYTGFAKAATEQGNALQSMSTEELQKRRAQLKGGQ